MKTYNQIREDQEKKVRTEKLIKEHPEKALVIGKAMKRCQEFIRLGKKNMEELYKAARIIEVDTLEFMKEMLATNGKNMEDFLNKSLEMPEDSLQRIYNLEFIKKFSSEIANLSTDPAVYNKRFSNKS